MQRMLSKRREDDALRLRVSQLYLASCLPGVDFKRRLFKHSSDRYKLFLLGFT